VHFEVHRFSAEPYSLLRQKLVPENFAPSTVGLRENNNKKAIKKFSSVQTCSEQNFANARQRNPPTIGKFGD
jgi:hypothetical protein